MSTKDMEKLVREVKATMNVEEWEKLVQDVRDGKIGTKDMVELDKDGKRDQARAVGAVLFELEERRKYEPDESIRVTGDSIVYKRRGRFVVQDLEGNWKLKNPPRRNK